MKSSSSTSSILRLNDKNHERGPSLRRSNSNSVTVLHQKQLPSYGAERFYILSELQMNSVPPTFLSENSNSIDDSMTEETVDVHSLEGSNSREASHTPLPLPLQPFSILYIVWRPMEDRNNESDCSVTSFCDEVIVPAVHKIQGIVRIRRPSIGQSSSSSSLSRYGSEDDFNDDCSEHQNLPDVRQPAVGESDSSSTTSTRLYLVVEQVSGNASSRVGTEDSFSKLERCATELARCVSTHAELRDLVQGVTVGVSNLERAAPGLEACMNALHVGSQDRRRHGISPTPEGGSKSLIGLVTDSYSDLTGPEDHHSHDHVHRGDEDDNLPAVLQQCLVTAEWSAAGDLMTFAQRAHNVWRDQHRLPALSTKSNRKKPIRRTRSTEVGVDSTLTAEEMLYQSAIFVILLVYFFFHYRNDAIEVVRYIF